MNGFEFVTMIIGMLCIAFVAVVALNHLRDFVITRVIAKYTERDPRTFRKYNEGIDTLDLEIPVEKETK